MRSTQPRASRHISRVMIGIGLLVASALPLLWIALATRPLPYEQGLQKSNTSPVFWLYPLSESVSQSSSLGILIALAAGGGIFLAMVPLLKGAPRGSRVLVEVVVVLLILASTVYSFAVDNNPGYQHSDSVTAHGKYYRLIKVEYPSGPEFELVLACDRLGVRCEHVMQAGGLDWKPIDLPAVVNQLPLPR